MTADINKSGKWAGTRNRSRKRARDTRAHNCWILADHLDMNFTQGNSEWVKSSQSQWEPEQGGWETRGKMVNITPDIIKGKGNCGVRLNWEVPSNLSCVLTVWYRPSTNLMAGKFWDNVFLSRLKKTRLQEIARIFIRPVWDNFPGKHGGPTHRVWGNKESKRGTFRLP